jgi:SAM-dependent methyltransferase
MRNKLNQFLIKSRRCTRVALSKIRIKIRTFLFKNHGKDSWYFCPCCDHSFTRFIDWSDKYRNVICPYCDSQPRHRTLILLLQQQYKFYLNKPIKMLYVAPENSLKCFFDSKENIEYITADLNDTSVDVQLDITQIPYDDNTFDIIFCNHVLEHIVDDQQAMKELLRILKPNGWASLQVPIKHKLEKTFEDSRITTPQDRLRYFGQEDHVRWYGLDYPERLKKAGFNVEITNLAQSLSSEEVRKYGLRHKENLYFGKKP